MKLTPELRFPEFNDEEDWGEKLLSDVCEITNGKANAQDHTEDGLYPLFDRSEVIKATNNYIFDCEAVIIPGEGMRFIPKYYEGRFNLHQRAYALKDFSCIGRFVYYSMFYRSNLISQKAVRSTVLSLRLPILQNFPIEIPSNPDEQQKIASCLTSLDELLAAHNEKLEALKDHKKGLLQNLFPQEGETVPKVRFPEFEDDGEWVENELGKICDVRDGTHDSPKYVSDGYPLITSKNLFENGAMDFENVSYLTQEDYDKINQRSKVDVGDILFGMIGTIGNPVIVKRDGFAIKNVALIKTKGLLEQEYLIQLLKSNYIDIQFQKANAGGILKFIALGMIRKLIIPTPKKEEQQKIASCLSAVDELITAQQEKIEQLQQHKKGLMQGLFPKIES